MKTRNALHVYLYVQYTRLFLKVYIYPCAIILNDAVIAVDKAIGWNAIITPSLQNLSH